MDSMATPTASKPSTITVRPARSQDVTYIRELVRPYAEQRILLEKEAVAYYEALQEFRVAEDADGRIIGCGAFHVMWEDIGEIRTLAVHPDAAGQGCGGLLLEHLLQDARQLGIHRVFCLTFEVDFFKKHGFEVMDQQDAVAPEVFQELLRSHDDGVAEFLDLARVKQNTLGNTRMITTLSDVEERITPLVSQE
ncbi:amino-acid N-acetyltransferase [Pseudoglutamicibacter cumminsii]|uniref:amino-acid N-acetyltransferase n=1 Tax=Pseudoglutamicibacter cumminsii TaxID=156979 RepID=UPI003A0FE193